MGKFTQDMLLSIVISDNEEIQATGAQAAEPCSQRTSSAPSCPPQSRPPSPLSPPQKRQRCCSPSVDRGSCASEQSGADLAFEDDDEDCSDFIPSGALRGAAAAVAGQVFLPLPAVRPPPKPRPLPAAVQALIPTRTLSAPREVAAADLLTAAQTRAVQLVAREAQPKSKAAEVSLKKRLRSWGYEEGSLEQVLAYIRDEAPIIIHIDLKSRLDKLMASTHYKNQFETNLTCGSNDLTKRRTWEDRLFQGIYSAAIDKDRVKYGVLNAVNDPCGIATVASQYGKDYFVLRGVRLRTTFSDRDSCNKGELASCEWYAHVLEKYTDLELRAVVEVALGEKLYAVSSVLNTASGGYKEVQIHGELLLAKHIEVVVVHNDRRGTELGTLIKNWCQQIGVRMEYMPPSSSSSSSSKATPTITKTPQKESEVRSATITTSTPLWRWGPCEPGGPRIRFDAFTCATMEEHFFSQGSRPLPTFPVGTVDSVDRDAKTMVIHAEDERGTVALERCTPIRPTSPDSAATATLPPASEGEAARRVDNPPPSGPPARWEWAGSSCGTGGWVAYDAERSAVLEAAFQQGARQVTINVGKVKYKVDITFSTQTNLETGHQRHVRRLQEDTHNPAARSGRGS